MSDRRVLALAAVGVAGVRIGSRLWVGLLAGVDFDEGAYFSSAAALARGHVPYRDAAAAHPPGLSLLVAPLTWLGSPDQALGWTRLAMGLLGATTAWLVGDLVLERTGRRPAALVAMVIYALLPEVAQVERSVLVEPLLNLTAVATIRAWFASPASAVRTGLWWGAALLTKSWAVLLVVPVALDAWRTRRWRGLGAALGTAGAVVATVLLPIVAMAGGPFVRQVVAFQLGRPDEGVPAWERAASIVGWPGSIGGVRSLPATVVVVGAAVAAATLRRPCEVDRLLAIALSWWVVVVGVFLAAPSYYVQYHAHLGPATALAGGAAAAVALERLDGWTPLRRRVARLAGVAVTLVAAVVVGPSLRWPTSASRDSTSEVAALVRSHRGCLWSFDPGWLVVGGRLPDVDRFGPVATEPFVGALSEAIAAGEGSDGLAAPTAQRVTRAAVGRCASSLVGDRGREQLGPAWSTFTRTHRRVRDAGPDGPDLWVER